MATKRAKKSDKIKITRALIIDEPWIDYILDGNRGVPKDWEMRSTNTKLRGPIGLIEKGTGKIVGVAELTDTKGPLERDQMLSARPHHQIPSDTIKSGDVDKWNHAWVLENTHRLRTPIRYDHPPGAVIWVKLGKREQDELSKALEDTSLSAKFNHTATLVPGERKAAPARKRTRRKKPALKK